MSSRRVAYEIRNTENYLRTRMERVRALKKDPAWFRNTKLMLGATAAVWALALLYWGMNSGAVLLLLLSATLIVVPLVEKQREVRIKKTDPRLGTSLRIRLGEHRFHWEFDGWIGSGEWSEKFRAHRFDDGIAVLAGGLFYWLPDSEVSSSTPDIAWSLLMSRIEGCFDHRETSTRAAEPKEAALEVVPPKRVSRSYTQNLVGTPAQVFPLLCPVREADWIEGWSPLLVVSESGVAEPDCSFVTDATPHDSIWTITRHEPEQGFVEMLKVTPEETVCRLSIQLKSAEAGSQADITYQHTSLGPAGDTLVEEFTEAHFETFMREWEERLNDYLENGRELASG